MPYSDTQLTGTDCSTCHGTGRAFRGKHEGQQCPRCEGTGRLYPLRREKMAEAFRDGDMPEQTKAPTMRWCETCRPNGAFKNCEHGWKIAGPCEKCKRNKCTACAGRTMVSTT
jgi:RecJ-like exonuclease